MYVTHEIKAFVEEDSEILILGSIPSIKSREEGFYYMHPKNRFWSVLAQIYQEELPSTIALKKEFLKRHKIALFDVLASCEIEGSKDASIRNPKPNKLLPIIRKSKIARIYTTGKKAEELYQKFCEKELNWKAIPLPSTSPLNAAMKEEKLVKEYEVLKEKTLEKIVQPLLLWYKREKRSLPWRNTKDPYKIWISEVMLQQTRVETVKEYYNRFIETLPNLSALAMVEEDVLFKLWEGLGYYSRAKNLQKAAIQIEEEFGGIFPKKYQDLLHLKGIGSYTAGAISSIAFHEANPAVDGNVFRVLSRLLNVEEDIMLSLTRIKMEHRVKEVLTKENAKELNQALMELGAMICLPKEMAKCKECPLSSFCKAYSENTVTQLPVKNSKKEKKILKKTILILECNGCYAILKRPNKGLLAGLYQFPDQEGFLSKKDVISWIKQQNTHAISIQELEEKKHIFTHQIWKMKGFFIRVEEEIPTFLWCDLKELKKYSIPTAYMYYAPKR